MPPKPQLTPRRRCELALLRARQCVAQWDALPQRAAALRDIRTLLEPAADPAFVAMLHLCHAAVSRAAFETLLAALEQRSGPRVAGRVTDATFLMQPDANANPARAAMPLITICAEMRSAFNIGGVLRTTECFGGEAVWGCGYTATPQHHAVRHAAMGTDQWVPWHAFTSATDALAALREKSYRAIALEITDDAASLDTFTWPFPCGLLIGNERFGLSRDIASAADFRVRIPMFGRKNSLNVVSALAIALHAARAQWEQR